MANQTVQNSRAKLAARNNSLKILSARTTTPGADSVKAARAAIQVTIDPTRDALLTNFGRATLQDRYLLPGETTQHLFARVARAYADDAAHAQRLYDYMSKLWFLPATPILSNGGTERGLPISCFLNAVEDNLDGIVGTWTENVRSWTEKSDPKILVLRYEDMLNNPIKTFGGLAQFLGLNPPRKRLERAIERASFKSLRKQEDEKGFKEKSPFAQKFFREGRAGQWRALLTQAQIDKLVDQNKEQMQRFGYWPLR